MNTEQAPKPLPTPEQLALIRRQAIREKFLIALEELLVTDRVKYKKVKKNYERWVHRGCPVIESFPKKLPTTDKTIDGKQESMTSEQKLKQEKNFSKPLYLNRMK
jgi:hypothetical protein